MRRGQGMRRTVFGVPVQVVLIGALVAGTLLPAGASAQGVDVTVYGGGGGGGGGGIAIGPTTTTTTTTTPSNVQVSQPTPTTVAVSGTVSVSSSGGVQASFDAAAVQTAIGQAQSTSATTIELQATPPASAQVAPNAPTTISLTANAAQALAASGKSVVVSTPGGQVTLSAADVQALSQAATAGTTVTITITVVPESSAGASSTSSIQSFAGGTAVFSPTAQVRLLATGSGASSSAGATPAATGLEQVSNAVQIGVSVQSASGTTTQASVALPKPVTISIPLNTSQVNAQNLPLAGVYLQDPQTQGWTYVGPCGAPAAACAGQISLTSGNASVSVASLGTYAVLVDNVQFADMAGNWAEADVDVAAAHHIVDGVTATTFDPNGAVSRAQFSAMIDRLLMLPTPSTAPTFSDVPSDAWYAPDVAAAAAAGIVTGFPGGTFEPNATITREQMALMIYRAMTTGGAPGSVTSDQENTLIGRFPDGSKVSSWARLAVAVALNEQILTGEPSGLVPQGTATRAEAAVMLKRLLSYFGAF